jgi:enoyl-CoA hydratase
MDRMKSDIDLDARPGGLVCITVNRAEKHNALAGPVLEALARTVGEAAARPEARVIVLRGAGERFFAAGGDIVELSAVRTDAQVHQMADASTRALDAVRSCPLPVIAYLNGDAIGGGAELALACDLRAVAPHARIGFVQGRLGITSAWGGGPDLFELVGSARALRMMTRCEMVGAAEAVSWGLADLQARDGFEGEDLAAFVRPMLERSRSVLEGIKQQAIAWREGRSRSQRREVERTHILSTWASAEHWAAVDRFMNKGK